MNHRDLLSVLALATTANFAAAQELPRGNVIHLPPGATVTGVSGFGGDGGGAPLVVGPPATTVQLPTFNFFTISTTVLVPDRGGAYLGGVGRGGTASRSSGVPGLGGTPGFGNRAGGSTIGASGMSVGVQIHDLTAMDKALLDEAKAARDVEAGNVWANRFEQARQSSAGRPTMSVAAARRLRDSTPAEKR